MSFYILKYVWALDNALGSTFEARDDLACIMIASKLKVLDISITYDIKGTLEITAKLSINLLH